MKVYFLKQKALDMLEKDISDNVEKYQGTEQWAENYFISKDMPNYYFDTEIEVPDYQLIIGGPETDFQNAKIVYETFSKRINPVQASDLRLRSYARNKVLVLAALKELKAHPELGRTEIRLFLAKLNQAGAIKVLDFLDKAQAEELCAEVMTEVVNAKALREGSKFKAFDNLTGKKYGPNLSIIDGRVVAVGKVLNTKPQNLIGKKEGTQFVIAGRKGYTVK